MMFLNNIISNRKYLFLLIILSFIINSCEPLVDSVDEVIDCTYYKKDNLKDEINKDTLLIMTWNIRFGCGSEIGWFGDACGSRTVLKRIEVENNLDRIIEQINILKPDILLLQEVDNNSKRSSYINQTKYIFDRTYFKYSVYGHHWKAQFIPSDGLGRIEEGKAIFSVFPISEAKMHPLPQRGDLDALTKIFYAQEDIQSCKILLPDNTFIRVINIHLNSYSSDDTKKRQLEEYVRVCNQFKSLDEIIITGGDFNMLPPNSDSTDYCDEDKCSDEHFHSTGDDPFHKEGSNYLPEKQWFDIMYNNYSSSLPLDIYKEDQSKYFTYCQWNDKPMDRTLDYLFTNRNWIPLSHKVYQDAHIRKLSDHCPVSAKWSKK